MVEISQRVADHLAGTAFADLPPRTVAATKRALLDAIGVSLAATGMGEGCAAFLDLAVEEGGAPLASVLGRSAKVPPAQAAFANGALAHAIDFEDTHDAAAVHPNAATVPAALAVAEARRADGRDLILAVALGCDLVCRIGLGLTEDPAEKGWYTPAILSAYGAAAAAGRLLGLDRRGMLDALSLTLCQATCSAEIKRSPDSLVRSVREAFSARAGVAAAQLAGRGITGFDRPLDGKAGFFALYGGGGIDTGRMLDGLGTRFEIDALSFKPWPTCRGTHVYVDMLLGLMGRHGLAAADVAAIAIDVNGLNVMLCEPAAQKRAPRTAIDAKFSLPFTLSGAALNGPPHLGSFGPAALADPAVLALAARVEHRVEPDWAYREATRGRLSVRTVDGRTFAAEETVAPGHPDRPMSDAALADKFRACAALAARPLPPDRIERAIAIVADLERHSVAELMAAVTP